MIRITELVISQREIQLRAPFVTALRSVSSYPVIEVRLTLDSGAVGWGDCVATPAISGDSHDQIWDELHSPSLKALIDCEYSSATDLKAALTESGLLPSARSALDIAISDVVAPIIPVQIGSDVTIPICSEAEFEEIFTSRVAAGFNAFKVKSDRASAAALAPRLARISQGGPYLIRIDPNQSWDLDLAVEVMREVEARGIAIEYLEQPLPRSDLAGHEALARLIQTPLMADESVFNISDLERVADREIFTWINVKLLKSGGYTPAKELAQRALALGMKVSIGSMMEGERGIKAAAQLAYEIAPEISHDLDAAWWFQETTLSYSESILST